MKYSPISFDTDIGIPRIDSRILDNFSRISGFCSYFISGLRSDSYTWTTSPKGLPYVEQGLGVDRMLYRPTTISLKGATILSEVTKHWS